MIREQELKTTTAFLTEDWDYYVSYTLPQKDVSYGDCYMALYTYIRFISAQDPTISGVIYICQHGEDGRPHLHGLLRTHLPLRRLEKAWRFGIKHVKRFAPEKRGALYEYLMGQRVGQGISVRDLLQEETR